MRIWQVANAWVITLVSFTILLPLWGPVLPMDAVAEKIKSPGTWTPACVEPGGLACMPEGREGAATTLIKNQIIVTHGSRPVPDVPGATFDSNDTRIYDIHTNTWFSGAPAPTFRAELAGAAHKGRVYAVGGRGPFGVLAHLEVYDVHANTWASLPPMPTARAGLAAAVVGHMLYAIGGRKAVGFDPGREPGTGMATQCIEAYDIKARTWASSPSCLSGTPPELTDMPFGAMDVAAIAHEGKIYVIGGAGGPDSSGGPLLPYVQIYHVDKNAWSFGAPMPTARANLALARCENVILALGGRIGPALPVYNQRTVEAYEIHKDDWTGDLTPMPTAKSEHGAVSHGGHGGVVHVLGSGIFGNPQNFHEALTCSSLFKD